MNNDDIIAFVEGLDGVLTLRPASGDGSPEIAWGDTFFYYAPDGTIPKGQPFATIVTKDYPDDESSRLNRPGAYRVNLYAGKDAFVAWLGHAPRDLGDLGESNAVDDTVIAHPVYGRQGWLAVVNPGPRTREPLRELLRSAYDLARSRHDRHA